MEKLKMGDKLLEIIRNNQKLSKRITAGALGLFMAFAPAHELAKAEQTETPSSATYLASLLNAEPEEQQYEMTLEEFENGAAEAYQYLKQYIDYEHMIEDVLAMYYITNYEYISDDLTEELISKGYIADTDMFDPDGIPQMDRSGWENINHYNRLVNSINDYNEGRIQREYYDGSISPIENYIDASIFCAEEYDKEDMHELFELWYKEYNLEKDTIRSNEPFMQAHKHLTHLNSEEKTSQLYDASLGARYTELKVYGNQVMDFQTDYMYENYKYSDLDVYFLPDELRQNQWFLRDDFEKQDCPDELYFCARMYGEHYHFVRDEVNKDIFSVMRTRELARETQETIERSK